MSNETHVASSRLQMGTFGYIVYGTLVSGLCIAISAVIVVTLIFIFLCLYTYYYLLVLYIPPYS